MTQTVMADFVFGGIEADERLLIAAERSRWSGLRHEHALQPLDPLPDAPVTVTVSVGPDAAIDQMTIYLTTDGSDPQGSRGQAHTGRAIACQRVDTRWEPLVWGYVEVWQGVIPGQPDGVLVRYAIEGWHSSDANVSHWSREQNLDRTLERPTLYAYHVDRQHVPEWARDAVVYQIFVDRFRDPRRSDADHGYLDADALGDFWGGSLAGVIDQLDYIAGVGVSVIWLSPIFVTPSYHGYDTTDYFQVDPRFGTNEELRVLVQEAHKRGLRVLLDFVANHTSLDFAPFADALADAASPYRRWFSFDPAYKHGYRTFFNVASMPQFNLDDPGARQHLFDAAHHWLYDYDVDGFRLDYAAGPSHAFWAEFRAVCRAVKPDCWLFGEVTRAGSGLRTYAGRLDGCLDFSFARAVRQLITGASADSAISAFASQIVRSRTFFGDDFVLPAFLDNHDMNRFLLVVDNDKQRLRLAAGLLFAFGQAPILYYGTEVGLSQPRPKGPHREEARHPMWWGEAQDGELLAFFKQLIALRRSHAALSRGAIVTLHVDDAVGGWLAERTHAADRVLIAVNVGEKPWAVALPPGDWRDLTGNVVRGMIDVAARSVSILLP